MMGRETLTAVFEHGAFRLIEKSNLLLRDGQRVRLTIEIEDPVDDALALATSVYDGLSPQDIADVERIALRATFCH